MDQKWPIYLKYPNLSILNSRVIFDPYFEERVKITDKIKKQGVYDDMKFFFKYHFLDTFPFPLF